MRKIREVLRLKYELGFTHRTIAKALRVAVGTVSEYLAKAKKGGLSWPLPEELSDGELEAGLFPPPGGCVPRFVEKERRPPLRHQSIISGGNLRVFENLAQTLVAVDAS